MNAHSLTVDKIEVAKRQVSEAIRLFFEERDLVAIHALASASVQVAADLARHKGLNSSFRDTQLLDADLKKKLVRAIKSLENFLKHADRDPDGVAVMYPEITEVFLAEATATLQSVGAELTAEMEVYQVWFVHKYASVAPWVSKSETYQRFDVPGTDWEDLRFFRILIDIIRDARSI